MQTLMQTLRQHAAESRQQDAPASAPTEDPDGNHVLKILYREDRKHEDERFGGTIIHASSFSRLPGCARMLYLGKYLRDQGMTYPSPPFGSMKLVWAFGRAAEKHVRETLLLDPDMRRAAFGVWKCLCGHTQVRGHLPPSPPVCAHCRGRALAYHEPTLIDRAHGVSGSPDFTYLAGNRYRVVEIKSIKGQSETSSPSFDQMDTPQPAHVEQGTHYVRLYENEGLPVHPVPHVLYVKKEFDTKKWYRLAVPTEAQMRRAYEDVDNSRRVSRAYTDALSSGVTPPMLDRCVSSPSTHQKACPVWAECMARRATP